MDYSQYYYHSRTYCACGLQCPCALTQPRFCAIMAVMGRHPPQHLRPTANISDSSQAHPTSPLPNPRLHHPSRHPLNQRPHHQHLNTPLPRLPAHPPRLLPPIPLPPSRHPRHLRQLHLPPPPAMHPLLPRPAHPLLPPLSRPPILSPRF